MFMHIKLHFRTKHSCAEDSKPNKQMWNDSSDSSDFSDSSDSSIVSWDEEPRDLQFDINEDRIPTDFLVKDARFNNQRHIIFATSLQLLGLANAREWYVDGTPKLVCSPFVQLWSIHAWVQSDDEHMAQVPLVQVLMSRQKTNDYVKVLEEIKQALPKKPVIETFVSDYEATWWLAFNKVFPNVRGQGCYFQWTKAVWWQIQKVRLQTIYKKDDRTHRFLRLVMSLPYLSPEDIVPEFERLEKMATHKSIAVQDVIKYVRKDWIENPLWTPSALSVFGRSERTNNAVKGWHREMFDPYLIEPDFYMFISFLFSQACCAERRIRAVKNRKCKRRQRKKYRVKSGKIQHLWERNAKGELSAKKLLKAVSQVLDEE